MRLDVFSWNRDKIIPIVTPDKDIHRFIKSRSEELRYQLSYKIQKGELYDNIILELQKVLEDAEVIKEDRRVKINKIQNDKINFIGF